MSRDMPVDMMARSEECVINSPFPNYAPIPVNKGFNQV